MKAFRIDTCVIVADIPEEAREFFIREISGKLPGTVEELDSSREILCADGMARTVKAIINDEMERRNEWLRLGVPCELHWPFLVEEKTGGPPERDEPGPGGPAAGRVPDLSPETPKPLGDEGS